MGTTRTGLPVYPLRILQGQATDSHNRVMWPSKKAVLETPTPFGFLYRLVKRSLKEPLGKLWRLEVPHPFHKSQNRFMSPLRDTIKDAGM